MAKRQLTAAARQASRDQRERPDRRREEAKASGAGLRTLSMIVAIMMVTIGRTCLSSSISVMIMLIMGSAVYGFLFPPVPLGNSAAFQLGVMGAA